MELQDRVAFVTGAGEGIGKAAALRLAREGARIAAVDISPERLAELAAEIEHCGGQVLQLAADVSQPDQMQQAHERVATEWNRLDIVFANAGINGVWAPLDELSPEDWDRTLGVNLKGTFLSLKYGLPLLKRAGGSVVITASVNGTRVFSNTGATAYSCSKGAQVIFAKMTALELAKYRIRVNAICPGSVHTSIADNTFLRNLEREKERVVFPDGDIPLTRGKAASAEQVAELVLFLASDRASHITGTEMWIDGAQSLLLG
jgi:NAD(P)-dependent dehydrogenase (short-subunit alcohol dehydrogenase family)